MKNLYNEEYPNSLEELIKQCEGKLALLLESLKDPNCHALGDFYSQLDINSGIQRSKAVFDSYNASLNNYLNENKKTVANNEIKGLYIFGECIKGDITPKYIGISRTVFRRLKQHGWGKYHNESTFAYLMASKKSNYNGERNKLPFEYIQKEQEIIKDYKVAILPEVSDYNLYFMEVYFAGKLKTYWNTFRTH